VSSGCSHSLSIELRRFRADKILNRSDDTRMVVTRGLAAGVRHEFPLPRFVDIWPTSRKLAVIRAKHPTDDISLDAEPIQLSFVHQVES
jgi:hypothetical protein